MKIIRMAGMLLLMKSMAFAFSPSVSRLSRLPLNNEHYPAHGARRRRSLDYPTSHATRVTTRRPVRALFNKAFSRIIARTENDENNSNNSTDIDIEQEEHLGSRQEEDTHQDDTSTLASDSLKASGDQSRDMPDNEEEDAANPEQQQQEQRQEPIKELEAMEEAMELDIFNPSFLLSPVQPTTAYDGTDSDDNSRVKNQSTTNEDFHDALELLGPMTLSDPAFKIGLYSPVAVDSNNSNFNNNEAAPTNNILNMTEWMFPTIPVVKGTSIPSSSKNSSGNNKKKLYTPRPSILETNKLFNTTSIKLPPIILPYATTSNANASSSSATPAIFLPMSNSNNNGSSAYYYDTKAALAFLDSQANFTMQQMEAAQKILWETSANASKQLDSAQKAFLQYGTQVLGEAVAAANRGGNGMSVEELEAYLRLNGYVKQTDFPSGSSSGQDYRNTPNALPPPTANGQPFQVGRGRQRVMTRSSTGFDAVGANAADLATSSSKTSKKGRSDTTGSGASKKQQTATVKSDGRRVAFPQPSVLSYAKLKWGCTVSASLLGLLGGITIVPNLWLLGAIFGGLYGYETTKNLAEKPPTHALSKVIVVMGRALTLQYLKVRDFVAGLWFMYKTGQLSYDYWKKYAELDQRFAIQVKIDAWNARFQKGKENFDKWEQENEVGRKILAGLRTVWLVDEQSKRNSHMNSRLKQFSNYRIVQYLYSAWRYLKKQALLLYARRGQALKEMQALAEGMRQELVDWSQWQEKARPRIAAALAALTFVNLTGALFAASPLLLGFLAVVLGGIVWPTWFSEWLRRVGVFFEETKAKGRKPEQQPMEQLLREALPDRVVDAYDKKKKQQAQLNKNDNIPVFSWPFRSEKEKEQYHFYRQPDGSKKWYRTGSNPWDFSSILSNGIWKQKEEEEKPWWSLN